MRISEKGLRGFMSFIIKLCGVFVEIFSFKFAKFIYLVSIFISATVTLHTAKRPNELAPSIIDKISYNIGSDWRRFGRHLNLEEAELELIDSDIRKTTDKASKVLTSWCQKKKNQNWELLKVYLESFQRMDIITMVEKEFKSDKTAQHDSIKIEKGFLLL